MQVVLVLGPRIQRHHGAGAGAGRNRSNRDDHADRVKVFGELSRVELARRLVWRKKRRHEIVLNNRDPAVVGALRIRSLVLCDVLKGDLVKLVALGVESGPCVGLRHIGIARWGLAVPGNLEIGVRFDRRSRAVGDFLGQINPVALPVERQDLGYFDASRSVRFEADVELFLACGEVEFPTCRPKERPVVPRGVSPDRQDRAALGGVRRSCCVVERGVGPR